MIKGVRMGYNEPTRLLEKKIACPFCQKKHFHVNEFWKKKFATCSNKCL
jgi:hypothetical protein